MTIGDPQFLKKLNAQETEGIDPELKTWITNHLLSDKRIQIAKTMDNNRHRYDLEIDDDTHWALVKIAAEYKMHHEDYAEQVLKGHVEQYTLDQQTSN